ncbi:hypothetical protein VH98_14135, partial [Acinetobacter brisouii]
FTGGAKVSYQIPPLPISHEYSNRLDLYKIFQWSDFQDIKYKALFSDNRFVEGNLDELGRTQRFGSNNADKMKVFVGYSADTWHKETEDFEDFEEYIENDEDLDMNNNTNADINLGEGNE